MKDHSDLGGMFDMTGVVRGEDGIKRYEGLPRNLVQMFRAAVDQQIDTMMVENPVRYFTPAKGGAS
jgi:hypothetical protein